jgi:hypothetical protein
MTQQEYDALCVFIDKLLYEIMTLEDYEIVLNRLDIPIRVKGSDRWGLATGCHNVNAYDGGSNLSFYTEDRSFYCFSGCRCSYNLLTLVEKRFQTIGKPRKRLNCLRYICDTVGIPFNFECEIKHENTTLYNWKVNLDKYLCEGNKKSELTVYNENKMLQVTDDLYIQDWLDEGICKRTQDYYGIRYYKYGQQAVIPVYDMLGQCVGIRVRNFNPEATAKYDVFRTLDGTEYKLNTSLTLYGIYQNAFNIKHKKKVIICESEKSVLMMDTMYGKDNNICLALMGSSLSDENVKTLVQLEVNEIIIGIDSDFHTIDSEEYDRFESKVMKIYHKLKPYCSNITVCYNNQGFDDMYKASPFDLGRERFELLWNKRERIE